jgi:nucleolar protein 56
LFRDKILDLIAYRDKMEEELTELMHDNAPNLSGLIGPLLGAKLIMLANGLDRLARMPGSRIQVLGAGRAMFRHLRQKGKAPKHGILFEHPLVGKSPWWQRGKIARSLSAKVSIAARLDAYSDEDKSAELKSNFMRRYSKIKEDFQSEPKTMRIVRRPGKKKDRFRRG